VTWFVFFTSRRPLCRTLFPYTTLFRSPPRHPGRPVGRVPQGDARAAARQERFLRRDLRSPAHPVRAVPLVERHLGPPRQPGHQRSEEHTSELQSRENLVCRLLLEKKKK